MENNKELSDALHTIAKQLGEISEFSTKGIYVSLNLHLVSTDKSLIKEQFTSLQTALCLNAPYVTKYKDIRVDNAPWSANRINVCVMADAKSIATEEKVLKEASVFKIENYTLEEKD